MSRAIFHALYPSWMQAVGKAKDGYGAARKTESEKKTELRAVQEKLKTAYMTLEEMSKAREEEGGEVTLLFEQKKVLQESVSASVNGIPARLGIIPSSCSL